MVTPVEGAGGFFGGNLIDLRGELPLYFQPCRVESAGHYQDCRHD